MGRTWKRNISIVNQPRVPSQHQDNHPNKHGSTPHNPNNPKTKKCVCVCVYICLCVYVYMYTHAHKLQTKKHSMSNKLQNRGSKLQLRHSKITTLLCVAFKYLEVKHCLEHQPQQRITTIHDKGHEEDELSESSAASASTFITISIFWTHQTRITSCALCYQCPEVESDPTTRHNHRFSRFQISIRTVTS